VTAQADKAKSPHDGTVDDIQPKIEVDGDEEMNIHDVRVEGNNKFSTVDAVCDVTDGRSVQKVVDEIIKKYGRIDVVVKYVAFLLEYIISRDIFIADSAVLLPLITALRGTVSLVQQKIRMNMISRTRLIQTLWGCTTL